MPREVGVFPCEHITQPHPRAMHENSGVVRGDLKLPGNIRQAEVLDTVQPERFRLLIGNLSQFAAEHGQ